MLIDQSSTQIKETIEKKRNEIEELLIQQAKVEKKEKQYQLLTGLDTFTRGQCKAMPDFELADKCRETTLFQIFSLIGDKLDFQVNIPVELAGKSIAQVLYVLDYIEDDKKLDEIDIQNTDEPTSAAINTY